MFDWVNHNASVRYNWFVFDFTQLNRVTSLNHLRECLHSINVSAITGNFKSSFC